MSLTFALAATAGTAACGWPASALGMALATPAGSGRDVIAGLRRGTTDAGASAGRSAVPASRSCAAADPRTTASGRPGPGAEWRRLATALAGCPLLAAVAFGLAVRLQPTLVAVAGCWLATCGLPLAIVDARLRRLPDALTAACFAGIAALLTAAAVPAGTLSALARAGGGALALAAFFAAFALLKPGSAGLGDAKLALSTGALAGWFGLACLLWAVFAAFALAAAYGGWLVAAGHASFRGGSLPFGPFLLAGCLLAVVWLPR